jgi:hypothetical protein
VGKDQNIKSQEGLPNLEALARLKFETSSNQISPKSKKLIKS